MLVEIFPTETGLGLDARGVAGSHVAGRFIAGYLVDDIQGSVSRATEVLGHLDAVKTSREAVFTESGNAYVITAKDNEVVLDFHWADEGEVDTAKIPLEEMQEALKTWISALNHRPVTS